MGMTEEAFFDQSLILWNDRLRGFAEMHGGASEERMTLADLERLEAKIDNSPQAAPARG